MTRATCFVCKTFARAENGQLVAHVDPKTRKPCTNTSLENAAVHGPPPAPGVPVKRLLVGDTVHVGQTDELGGQPGGPPLAALVTEIPTDVKGEGGPVVHVAVFLRDRISYGTDVPYSSALKPGHWSYPS